MIRTLRPRIAVLALAVLVSASAASAQEVAVPIYGRWTGVFRPLVVTSLQSGSNGADRYTGSVELIPVHESGLDMYAVTVTLSSNVAAQMLEWGVSMGRCGSKLIMLENANQLPQIEMRSGGEGEIKHTVALNMDNHKTYQVGVFRNGHAQQNMVACANLKLDDRWK